MIGALDKSALYDEVYIRSTGSGSPLHGSEHWRQVAVFGRKLLDETPEADPLVVFLFSIFHDSMRESDGHDPDHGRRGAQLARELREHMGGISDGQMDLLTRACEAHTDGRTSKDPIVGVCWDADRLDLWRIGEQPRPHLLSTAAAKKPGVIEWAREVRGEMTYWREVFRLYG